MSRLTEIYIFNKFKNLYEDFPFGEHKHCDKPDFIIKTPNKTIGIEITQIFTDNYINKSINLKRKESLQNKLGNELCEKLKQILPFKFVLSIDFSLKDFSKNKIDNIVSDCIVFLKKIKVSKIYNLTMIIENYGQLPEEIETINIFHYPTQQTTFFSHCAGGVLPDLTLKHLQEILNKKHEVLQQYKVCDEYWLLIQEGYFLADSFGDITIQSFETKFNKVFLYRYSKEEIIQLK